MKKILYTIITACMVNASTLKGATATPQDCGFFVPRHILCRDDKTEYNSRKANKSGTSFRVRLSPGSLIQGVNHQKLKDMNEPKKQGTAVPASNGCTYAVRLTLEEINILNHLLFFNIRKGGKTVNESVLSVRLYDKLTARWDKRATGKESA